MRNVFSATFQEDPEDYACDIAEAMQVCPVPLLEAILSQSHVNYMIFLFSTIMYMSYTSQDITS